MANSRLNTKSRYLMNDMPHDTILTADSETRVTGERSATAESESVPDGAARRRQSTEAVGCTTASAFGPRGSSAIHTPRRRRADWTRRAAGWRRTGRGCSALLSLRPLPTAAGSVADYIRVPTARCGVLALAAVLTRPQVPE